MIEQKGIVFDHDFGYPFLFPPNKRGKKKWRMNNQRLGQKTKLLLDLEYLSN